MGRHRAILASEQEEEEDAKGPARLLIVASRLPVVSLIDISYHISVISIASFMVAYVSRLPIGMVKLGSD